MQSWIPSRILWKFLPIENGTRSLLSAFQWEQRCNVEIKNPDPLREFTNFSKKKNPKVRRNPKKYCSPIPERNHGEISDEATRRLLTRNSGRSLASHSTPGETLGRIQGIVQKFQGKTGRNPASNSWRIHKRGPGKFGSNLAKTSHRNSEGALGEITLVTRAETWEKLRKKYQEKSQDKTGRSFARNSGKFKQASQSWKRIRKDSWEEIRTSFWKEIQGEIQRKFWRNIQYSQRHSERNI